jgi:hypothetical protein
VPNIDFSSGLAPEREQTALEQPEGQPSFGENQAFWVHDEASGIHINGHLNTCEDVGAFAQRIAKLSIIFPDGRTYMARETGPGSNSQTVASSNLRYECVEPFARWRCAFDGVMQDITIARRYYSGVPLDYLRTPVSFELDARMAAPAWVNGAFSEGGLGAVKSFMGGDRYEQLCRVSGKLAVAGRTYNFSGAGNRTHRVGRRDLSATPDAPRMLGHVWAAGLFPSGAGFGFQTYPKPDGAILWSEGYVVRDGTLVAADVVRAPWLRNYWTRGEPLEIILRTREGEVFEIAGETLGTSIGEMLPGQSAGEQISLFQSYARYAMRGETAINMIERSLRRSCIETGVGRPAA